MTNQYAADAQKLAQESSNGSALPNSQVPGSDGIAPKASADSTSPSQASQSQASSSPNPQSPGSQPNSNAPSSPSGTPSSTDYKQLMGVALNGVSSLNASNLYAAREMGKKAQKQVVEGYAHF